MGFSLFPRLEALGPRRHKHFLCYPPFQWNARGAHHSLSWRPSFIVRHFPGRWHV
jgi:hypothetical protein